MKEEDREYVKFCFESSDPVWIKGYSTDHLYLDHDRLITCLTKVFNNKNPEVAYPIEFQETLDLIHRTPKGPFSELDVRLITSCLLMNQVSTH